MTAKPEVLTRPAQKRWALFGCFGCSGFIALTVVLSLLGFRNALQPDNVWSQLHAYMDFEAPPEGFTPLFEVSFFDQRQIAFYRTADRTQVVLQEFTSRVREDFDEAFDKDVVEQDGTEVIESGTLELQGRPVEYIMFLGDGGDELDHIDSIKTSRRGKLLDWLGLLPKDLPVFATHTPVYQLRFSGANDGGGTLLIVRAPTIAPLKPADFEALFAPFDLWAFVDSAPVAPPDPNQTEPTPSDE